MLQERGSEILNPKSKNQDYCPVQNLAGPCLRKIKQTLTDSSLELLDQTHTCCFAFHTWMPSLDTELGYELKAQFSGRRFGLE